MPGGASGLNVLETDRLVLRCFVMEDAEFLLRLLNEPSFLRFIGDRGVRSVDDARKYILNGPVESIERNGFSLYLTELTGEGTPIGICGLLKRETLDDVDIGFAFLPEFWGNGYAYESASAVMDYARTELGISRVVAITAPDNHASKKVLERIGMKLERTIKLGEDGKDLELFAWEYSTEVTS